MRSSNPTLSSRFALCIVCVFVYGSLYASYPFYCPMAMLTFDTCTTHAHLRNYAATRCHTFYEASIEDAACSVLRNVMRLLARSRRRKYDYQMYTYTYISTVGSLDVTMAMALSIRISARHFALTLYSSMASSATSAPTFGLLV